MCLLRCVTDRGQTVITGRLISVPCCSGSAMPSPLFAHDGKPPPDSLSLRDHMGVWSHQAVLGIGSRMTPLVTRAQRKSFL